MKAIGNTVAMVGAVTLMGWLMIAQHNYNQSWNDGTIAQQQAPDASSIAASWVDHEIVVMK